MDFLSSLGLTEVPEQQTRISHNKSIIQALNSNPSIQLGFDACCYCGKLLTNKATIVSCPKCHRVSYCSEGCMMADTKPNTYSDDNENQDENPNANGHGSIICALLRLCQLDEDVEEQLLTTNTKKSPQTQSTSSKTQTAIQKKKEEAKNRIQSELESYPATLANMIMEGPCYQSILQSCRTNSNPLRIHIIGASEEAELWNMSNNEILLQSYAEAFSEMAEVFHISHIYLDFVGPDCPSPNLQCTQLIHKTKKQKSTLHFSTYNTLYNSSAFANIQSTSSISSLPDIIAMFNPGFTCPDYQWEEPFQCLPKTGIPFLITTNTEMEAILDCQYLVQHGSLLEYPKMVQVMLDVEQGNGQIENEEGEDHDDYEEEDDGTMFFGENPYAGSRIRQSGTMANDVYIKNRFVFGGPSLYPMKQQKHTKKMTKEVIPSTKNTVINSISSSNAPNTSTKKLPKKKKNHSKKHKLKRSNPALI